jgi:hypothetical protein
MKNYILLFCLFNKHAKIHSPANQRIAVLEEREREIVNVVGVGNDFQ